MTHKLGQVLMFLSSLAVGYFIMLYLEMRLFVSVDAFFVAIGLFIAFLVVLKRPVIGGILGVLVALYPLIESIQEILQHDDEVYYIYCYIIVTSILMITSSLLVVRSRFVR